MDSFEYSEKGCEALHMKLNEQEITERIKRCPGWNRDEEKWIQRKYRFSSFPVAMRFVHLIAEAAEALNHHPMISIDYRMVTLRLTTWNHGGLTELDFSSAHRYDQTHIGMNAEE